MDSEANERKVDSQTTENHDRREAVRKLGRLAAYAAPFTVLALTEKANAASGGGPGPLRH
jgi:hypothetical protein